MKPMPHVLKNFAEANEALHAYWPSRVTRHAYTLDYMEQLMAHLGNPQDSLKVVHVAGTSGKTSTAYYAAALLQAAGKKVGLTISPHVDEVNERVQINLVPLSEAEFCRELGEFISIVEASGIKTTYFEILMAFVYWEFARQRVDYAVIEVGLGGLLDASNVITREDKTCIITDIGLDHMKVLGHTVPEIALQKAGIIQLHNPVFCYDQGSEVMDVVRHVAIKKQADLHIVPIAHHDETNALPLFQQRNFNVALQAVNFVLERDDQAPALSSKAVAQAAQAYVPGRMDTLPDVEGKTLIMDGAHNGQKLAALVGSMQARYPGEKVAVLLSFVADREGRIEPGIAELVKIASHIIITKFAGGQDTPHDSADPQEIIDACQKAGFSDYEVVPDPSEALQTLLKRPEKIVLITGSFYMLAHVRPALKRYMPTH